MSNIYTLNKITAKLITTAGALAMITSLSPAFAPSAYATDCLLDTSGDGDADSNLDTTGNANSAGGADRLACGEDSIATGDRSTGLGASASAFGDETTAIGYMSIAGIGIPTGGSGTAVGARSEARGEAAVALGFDSDADGGLSTALGFQAITNGENATAIGSTANASGDNSIAIGSDSGDAGFVGATASDEGAIAIGTDSAAGHTNAIVIGTGAVSTAADQVVLKSADTFIILGNGDVGIGTDAPNGTLDVNSGVDDSIFLLSNDTAVWEFKSNAGNGKLTFGNKTTGTKPFKFGPTAVGNLLQVGIVADDEVTISGDLVMTGTLTTGGPTCGGGCDAVFAANYDLPSIEDHAAQMFAAKHLPEVGPTKPLEAINVSERMGTMLNELEKAHIYIADLDRRNKALTLEKRDMRGELDQAKNELDQTQARLLRLEALLIK